MGMEKVRKVRSDRKGKQVRRKQRKFPAVQKLYETCKQVFADCGPGIIPSPTAIEKLKSVLDGMTEDDVGLRPNMPYFRTQEKVAYQRITYLHLCKCDRFSIGIFCLPPSGVIPLHNHPGMTVFSKLLFGSMHIKAYDWADDGPGVASPSVDPANGNPFVPGRRRLAKVMVDSDFTAPCDSSILYPTRGGNMHCLMARTSCAILDVLGPPYSDPEGRHCQYYLDLPFSNSSVDRESYAWLLERDSPEGFVVVGVPYNGPKIAEN